MPGQLVTVDLRQGEYLVFTYSRTVAGLWVLDGRPARLPQGCQPDDLRLPDYATYAKGTRSVEVCRERIDGHEIIDVTPKHNEGGCKSFTPIDDKKCSFAYSSPEQLGIETIKAFGWAV